MVSNCSKKGQLPHLLRTCLFSPTIPLTTFGTRVEVMLQVISSHDSAMHQNSMLNSSVVIGTTWTRTLWRLSAPTVPGLLVEAVDGAVMGISKVSLSAKSHLTGP